MSISFTPSQVNVIQACLNTHDFQTGGEYTSASYHDLRRAFVFGPGRYDLIIEGIFREGGTVDVKLDYKIECEFEAAVTLVAQAYARFRKEFSYYRAKRCGLSEVRKYHRLLIDTLAPFNDDVEGF